MIRASFGRTAASRLLIGAGALALLSPAIAGCEAGANAPTLEYHAAAAGAYTVFNGIKVTNAFVLGAPSGSTLPAGSSASLFVSLFNEGSSPDRLVQVSAPGWASSVTLSGGTVALPVKSAVNLTGPQPDVVLKNLTKPLSGGSNISVTLDFQHAGKVTLQVPVEPRSFYWSTYSPPANPAAVAAVTSGKAESKTTATVKATASPSPAT